MSPVPNSRKPTDSDKPVSRRKAEIARVDRKLDRLQSRFPNLPRAS